MAPVANGWFSCSWLVATVFVLMMAGCCLSTKTVLSENKLPDIVPGKAGVDYPIVTTIPTTNFSCEHQPYSGSFADVEANCTVFRVCQNETMNSFLCPNGTLYHQRFFVCDWWFNVNCTASPEYYGLNKEIKLSRKARTTKQQLEVIESRGAVGDARVSLQEATPTPSFAKFEHHQHSVDAGSEPSFKQWTLDHLPVAHQVVESKQASSSDYEHFGAYFGPANEHGESYGQRIRPNHPKDEMNDIVPAEEQTTTTTTTAATPVRIIPVENRPVRGWKASMEPERPAEEYRIIVASTERPKFVPKKKTTTKRPEHHEDDTERPTEPTYEDPSTTTTRRLFRPPQDRQRMQKSDSTFRPSQLLSISRDSHDYWPSSVRQHFDTWPDSRTADSIESPTFGFRRPQMFSMVDESPTERSWTTTTHTDDDVDSRPSSPARPDSRAWTFTRETGPSQPPELLTVDSYPAGRYGDNFDVNVHSVYTTGVNGYAATAPTAGSAETYFPAANSLPGPAGGGGHEVIVGAREIDTNVPPTVAAQGYYSTGNIVNSGSAQYVQPQQQAQQQPEQQQPLQQQYNAGQPFPPPAEAQRQSNSQQPVFVYRQEQQQSPVQYQPETNARPFLPSQPHPSSYNAALVAQPNPSSTTNPIPSYPVQPSAVPIFATPSSVQQYSQPSPTAATPVQQYGQPSAPEVREQIVSNPTAGENYLSYIQPAEQQQYRQQVFEQQTYISVPQQQQQQPIVQTLNPQFVQQQQPQSDVRNLPDAQPGGTNGPKPVPNAVQQPVLPPQYNYPSTASPVHQQLVAGEVRNLPQPYPQQQQQQFVNQPAHVQQTYVVAQQLQQQYNPNVFQQQQQLQTANAGSQQQQPQQQNGELRSLPQLQPQHQQQQLQQPNGPAPVQQQKPNSEVRNLPQQQPNGAVLVQQQRPQINSELRNLPLHQPNIPNAGQQQQQQQQQLSSASGPQFYAPVGQQVQQAPNAHLVQQQQGRALNSPSAQSLPSAQTALLTGHPGLQQQVQQPQAASRVQQTTAGPTGNPGNSRLVVNSPSTPHGVPEQQSAPTDLKGAIVYANRSSEHNNSTPKENSSPLPSSARDADGQEPLEQVAGRDSETESQVDSEGRSVTSVGGPGGKPQFHLTLTVQNNYPGGEEQKAKPAYQPRPAQQYVSYPPYRSLVATNPLIRYQPVAGRAPVTGQPLQQGLLVRPGQLLVTRPGQIVHQPASFRALPNGQQQQQQVGGVAPLAPFAGQQQQSLVGPLSTFPVQQQDQPLDSFPTSIASQLPPQVIPAQQGQQPLFLVQQPTVDLASLRNLPSNTISQQQQGQQPILAGVQPLQPAFIINDDASSKPPKPQQGVPISTGPLTNRVPPPTKLTPPLRIPIPTTQSSRAIDPLFQQYQLGQPQAPRVIDPLFQQYQLNPASPYQVVLIQNPQLQQQKRSDSSSQSKSARPSSQATLQQLRPPVHQTAANAQARTTAPIGVPAQQPRATPTSVTYQPLPPRTPLSVPVPVALKPKQLIVPSDPLLNGSKPSARVQDTSPFKPSLLLSSRRISPQGAPHQPPQQSLSREDVVEDHNEQQTVDSVEEENGEEEATEVSYLEDDEDVSAVSDQENTAERKKRSQDILH